MSYFSCPHLLRAICPCFQSPAIRDPGHLAIRVFRTYLKNRILVQDRDGAEFKTGGILLYVEDFKRGSNKEIGPKEIFEIGSSLIAQQEA
jgi:hypothetical protein